MRGQLRQTPAGDSLRLSYLNGASFHTLAVALSPSGTFELREPALQQPVYGQLIGRDGRVRQAVAPSPSAGAETVAVLERALKE